MAAPYILARTLKDAHEFARDELGLSRGRYRVVTSPSTLSGRRGTDLYLVPGHENRHDRFAMRGALRYTRLNVIDVATQAEAPAELDGLTPEGTQPELTEGADPALVAEFEAFLTQGVADEETAGTPESAAGDPVDDDWKAELEKHLEPEGFEPPETLTANDVIRLAAEPDKPAAEVLAEEPAPADETKRRRRRCKECGVLVEPDEVEQHAAEHFPTEQ